jgi:hypothetical protein
VGQCRQRLAAPKHFDQHGGLARLRARARHENTAERSEHGQPVAKATVERAEQLRERLRGGTVLPEPVPFEQAVTAMLARPHAVGPTKPILTIRSHPSRPRQTVTVRKVACDADEQRVRLTPGPRPRSLY